MLKGSIPALVTPFKDGAVDFAALERLVEWHTAQGSHGLVPVGTTGESPTLNHEEHNAVVEAVVRAAGGRIAVVAGAGSNCTAESLSLVAHARAVGADAALVVTPYYNRPTQDGLRAHYQALAEVGLPIVIYNSPGRSAVDMAPATMAALARHDCIVGVKDATGDLARVCVTRLMCGPDVIQLSGEDITAHGFNAQGGVGCISVTANVAPKLCARMQEACLSGDYTAARDIQDRLMPLHQAIMAEPGVVGAKTALEIVGMCRAEARLPLTPVAPATRDRIAAALRHADLIG